MLINNLHQCPDAGPGWLGEVWTPRPLLGTMRSANRVFIFAQFRTEGHGEGAEPNR